MVAARLTEICHIRLNRRDSSKPADATQCSARLALRLQLRGCPISHGNLVLEGSSTILRCVVGPAQIRPVEKLPLQLATDLMHGARADDVAIGERMRDRVQKWIAQVDRQRPGGGHHGIEPESERRMGGMGNGLVALARGRGVAQGCAVLRFVSFVRNQAYRGANEVAAARSRPAGPTARSVLGGLHGSRRRDPDRPAIEGS